MIFQVFLWHQGFDGLVVFMDYGSCVLYPHKMFTYIQGCFFLLCMSLDLWWSPLEVSIGLTELYSKVRGKEMYCNQQKKVLPWGKTPVNPVKLLYTSTSSYRPFYRSLLLFVLCYVVFSPAVWVAFKKNDKKNRPIEK